MLGIDLFNLRKLFRRKKRSSIVGFQKQADPFGRKSFSFKKREKITNKLFVFGNRVNFWRRFFLKLSYLLLIVLFFGLIFVFFFTSFFVIENISLERENLRVDTGKVIDSLKDYRYRNILLVSTAKIESKIQADFPEYKTVEVRRILPNTLTIQVKNFDIIAQVKVFIKPQLKISEVDVKTLEIKPYEQILVLNSEGIVEQSNEAYASLPILEISQIQEVPLVQGDRLLEKKYLELILEAQKMLWEQVGIESKTLKYFSDAKEVHLITNQNYEIWVDFKTPISEQIDKLKKISNDVNWKENPPVEHIDLRVKNRIIYK